MDVGSEIEISFFNARLPTATPPKPYQTKEPMNPNHLLTDSIHRFITSYRTGSTDFSHFTSITSRFLHLSPVPPLELLWFHSALTFHSLKPHFTSLEKDLFHLLVSGSYPFSGPTTRVAALAPLISLLFNGLKDNGSLVERVIGYIGVCCNGAEVGGFGEEEGVLDECFGELALVWMVERVGEGCGIEEVLEGFLPGVSVGVWRRVGCGGCGVGYLAGVVMWEVLLLGFCFKVGGGGGVERVEFREELHDWVVRTLGAFRSYHFFDVLLSMLLEPSIPVNSLLNSRDRDLLYIVLYDAVIMEYPFLSPAKGIQLPDTYWKNLAMNWLFVVDKAIHFVRENGDEAKAISYVHAFSESNLPSQLIKYVISQPGMNRHPNLPPCLSTPLVLIKWLVYTDDQGATVFDNDIVKSYARTVACQSRTEHELFVLGSSGEKSGEHFHTGNKGKGIWKDKLCGEVEIWKRLDSACFTSPCSKKLIEYNRSRKRKDGCTNEWEKQVKFVRCHVPEDPRKQMVLPSVEDGLSCGSEVESPIADDDMAYMEV